MRVGREGEFMEARRLEWRGTVPLIPQASQESKNGGNSTDVIVMPVSYEDVRYVRFVGITWASGLSQSLFERRDVFLAPFSCVNESIWIFFADNVCVRS
jgi:hypothetical protein